MSQDILRFEHDGGMWLNLIQPCTAPSDVQERVKHLRLDQTYIHAVSTFLTGEPWEGRPDNNDKVAGQVYSHIRCERTHDIETGEPTGVISYCTRIDRSSPISKLLEVLTGHSDKSLWWISKVYTLVNEYDHGHDWSNDEDPSATSEALSDIREGVDSICDILRRLGVDNE